MGKLPTDENLAQRDLHFPSICSMCNAAAESSLHLFFDCTYAMRIWNWLANTLNIALHFQSLEDLWKLCDRFTNKQCKVVINAALVFTINSVWYARNQIKFNNRKIPWKSSISSIISNVNITGNCTNATSLSMLDFSLLKKFNITLHPPKAPQIKEIFWNPPLPLWMKCNTDGAASSITSACGGIFRNHKADFVFCFAENTGAGNAFHAELFGAMRAIEIATSRNWTHLWLELDSSLLVNAFKSNSMVPWYLRNRWFNFLCLIMNMNFIVSHIFREGNQCVDSLANLGLSLDHLTCWFNLPSFIHKSFVEIR